MIIVKSQLRKTLLDIHNQKNEAINKLFNEVVSVNKESLKNLHIFLDREDDLVIVDVCPEYLIADTLCMDEEYDGFVSDNTPFRIYLDLNKDESEIDPYDIVIDTDLQETILYSMLSGVYEE